MGNNMSAKEANQEVILEKNIIKINYLTTRSNPKIVRSICDQESAKSAVKMRGEVSGWFSEIVLMQESPYSRQDNSLAVNRNLLSDKFN